MAKQSGLGDNFYLNGYDLSGDVGAVQTIAGRRAALDVTAINGSAMERILGLGDGEMSFNSWFNDALLHEHVALSPLPTADVIASYFRGTTLGNAAASIIGKQVNYDGTRNNDGSLAFAVQVLGNAFALEWGQMLTAGLRTDTAATNGASIDTAASLSFGLSAILHVTAFAGTSVTVTLEDSANDSTWAAITGAAFTAASAIGAQRIATSLTGTVRRYIRAVTTGTFSSATFAVNVIKNETLRGA